MMEMEAETEAEWSQEGPTLSNDIWKKFQLIPTPPRSPSHEADLTTSDLTSFTDCDLPNFDLPSLDLAVDLENILLPDHLPNCGGPGGLPCASGTCTSCTQLALAGSELRHDCMWRGTCTAEAHAHHPRYPQQHTDSTSQIPELLLDSAAMECETDFVHLDDLQEDEDEDDDEAHMDDLDEVEDDLAARPETPSESSETDTDQEHDEGETEDEGEHVATAVHVDHSYHCLRAPSPRHAHAHALPHTPSESEDEIDVVSVGSPDSAYSSSSSRNGRPRLAGVKRKRGASRSKSGDLTTQALVTPANLAVPTTTPVVPTCAAATTTFVNPTNAGNRKILKVRSGSPQVLSSSTSSSTTKSSRHTKRAHHHLEKRSSTTNVSSTTTSSSLSTIIPDPLANSSTTTTTTTTSTVGASRKPTHTTKNTPSPTHTNTPYTTTTTSSKILKRIPKGVHHHHGRKKRGNRGESDDPERRHLHNSLERMRRVDLRNAFEELRSLVPDLCDREKAPKVEILRRASEHCYSLTQRGRLLEQEMEKQKRLQGELKRRLAALHKQQARV